MNKPIDIYGTWDESQGRKLVMDSLKKHYNALQCFDELDCLHQILGFFNVEINSEKKIIAVTASRRESRSCVSCTAFLSFFEFIKHEPGWILERSWIAAVENIEYGEPIESIDKINLFMIGKNKYGIFTEDVYQSKGYHTEFTTIYSLVGDDFKKVFSCFTYFDDSGAYYSGNWSSKIKILYEENNFHDLLVIRDGFILDKYISLHFGVSLDTEFPDTVLYKFNGVEYVESLIFE